MGSCARVGLIVAMGRRFYYTVAMDVQILSVTAGDLSGRGRAPGHLDDRIAPGRLQDPDDIAAMVAFLASDKGRNITGPAFNVNGGMEFN
jgi:NAD(P)-dependent dehydrogenase (short-subunit alcohol dehydrogenase family)